MTHDHLVEDEFMDRPDDDELAFLHYEKIFRARLDQQLEKLSEEDQNRYWTAYNHFMQTYINGVLSSVTALDLEILLQWINSPYEASNPENFQKIKYDIDSAIVLIKVRHAQSSRKSSVRLDKDTRSKIRDYITKIKTTIEGIELPLDRKEKLLSRLNAFSIEVDRDRARYEAIGALVVEAATIAGKAEAKLRPIRKWLDSIAGLLRAANGIEERQSRLPAPPKRIPGPPNRQGSNNGGNASSKPDPSPFDDDIPF
ncbi:hypothetical protein [Methylobacterium tarhaniae]|uniref:hypothetical protein n=1 Tax=Methylobacterium tarhaniae TaxID=1187852 RepID=UPI000ACAE37B|nr:hypothetical protein [Methylobacterium tarhaniae]